jgi:uncharacterized protein YuzE
MKLVYDAEVDALTITFRETTVTTQNLAEGIAADYDSKGLLAGIEILDVAKRFGGRAPLRQVVLDGFDSMTPAPAGKKHLVVAESGVTYGKRRPRK